MDYSIHFGATKSFKNERNWYNVYNGQFIDIKVTERDNDDWCVAFGDLEFYNADCLDAKKRFVCQEIIPTSSKEETEGNY